MSFLSTIFRALLESKNWDLEATAREQFGERDPPPPPPPLRPHDEAPELRQRLFGQPPVGPLNPRPPTPPVNPRGEGGTIANIIRYPTLASDFSSPIFYSMPTNKLPDT